MKMTTLAAHRMTTIMITTVILTIEANNSGKEQEKSKGTRTADEVTVEGSVQFNPFTKRVIGRT